jgi:AraC-like DNA-binding protein
MTEGGVEYLTLDQLQPSVDFASYCDLTGPTRHFYRVLGQHFLLVARGRIDARTVDGPVSAEAGDLLCFPAFDRNEYGYSGSVRFIEAHIHYAPPPHLRGQVWLDGIGPLPLRVPLGDGFARMQRVFETFCLELPRPGAVHRARVQAAAWEMLSILGEAVQPGTSGAVRLDRWQQARLRLSSDLARTVTVRRLASEARLSPEAFIRGFRRRFGISPGQYRTQQRLLHAAQRLRAGDIAIKALARELGFADASSFSRAFRRALGSLPSQLRAGFSGPAARIPDSPLLTANVPILPSMPSVDIGAEAVRR